MKRFPLYEDVHSLRFQGAIPLARVGVTDVKEVVFLRQGESTFSIIGSFDVFVNLPADLRGSHLSRNNEAINEIIWGTFDAGVQPLGESGNLSSDIGTLCVRIAKELLERHEYASQAEIHFCGNYWLPKETPSRGAAIQEVYGLYAHSAAQRIDSEDIVVRKGIGIEATGITTCPCAQNECRKWVVENLQPKLAADQIATLLEQVPFPTHMQRAKGFLMLDMPEEYQVRIEDLIGIVERSLSSETYEILKREEELQVILKAFSNPRFVEDSVRQVVQEVIDQYPELPDACVLIARVISEESVHKHNAVAEVISTLGEVRAQTTRQ